MREYGVSELLCKTEKCLHAAWLFLQCSAVTLAQFSLCVLMQGMI